MAVCAYCGVRFLDISGLMNDIPTLQEGGIHGGKVIGHQTTQHGDRCPRAKKTAAPPAPAPSLQKTQQTMAAAAPKKKAKAPKSTSAVKKTIKKSNSAGKGVAVAKKPSSKMLDTYLRASGLSTVGTIGLKTSRLLEGVKDRTVKVGDLKALAKELGVASSGSGDVLRPKLVAVLGTFTT